MVYARVQFRQRTRGLTQPSSLQPTLPIREACLRVLDANPPSLR